MKTETKTAARSSAHRIVGLLFDFAILLQQGWRPCKTRLWYSTGHWIIRWRDPQNGNTWMRETAIGIIEQRLQPNIPDITK